MNHNFNLRQRSSNLAISLSTIASISFNPSFFPIFSTPSIDLFNSPAKRTGPRLYQYFCKVSKSSLVHGLSFSLRHSPGVRVHCTNLLFGNFLTLSSSSLIGMILPKQHTRESKQLQETSFFPLITKHPSFWPSKPSYQVRHTTLIVTCSQMHQDQIVEASSSIQQKPCDSTCGHNYNNRAEVLRQFHETWKKEEGF